MEIYLHYYEYCLDDYLHYYNYHKDGTTLQYFNLVKMIATDQSNENLHLQLSFKRHESIFMISYDEEGLSCQSLVGHHLESYEHLAALNQ